jgi:mono/diheme cytochrome c family protein
MEVTMRCGWMGSAVAFLAAFCWGRLPADDKPAARADPAPVKRGEYLVNIVARCGDCHTPRNARGDLDMTRHLQGAPTWFTPTVKPKEWEDRAPNITAGGKAGKWSEDRMVKFLTTGVNGEGEKPDAPMPSYQLSPEDARAVTAYLRSLPGDNKGDQKKEDKKKGKEKSKKKEKKDDD